VAHEVWLLSQKTVRSTLWPFKPVPYELWGPLCSPEGL
jgi:hypothetical protein